ncbi:hypothetical protein GCM10017752_55930 [Streptomyces roseoviridis]
MKSLARDGDNDVGVRGTDASAAGACGKGDPGSAGGCSLVLMTQTLRPATDSERNTIDAGPRRTA